MLENVKVNTDKYYKVGYSPYLKKYVMAITITWIEICCMSITLISPSVYFE